MFPGRVRVGAGTGRLPILAAAELHQIHHHNTQCPPKRNAASSAQQELVPIIPCPQKSLHIIILVGQRFISLIGDSHSQFTIHALGASPRSAGKLYPEAVNWKLAEEIPSSVSNIEVRTCEPTGPFTECDIVFSGLDADVAGEIGFPFIHGESVNR